MEVILYEENTTGPAYNEFSYNEQISLLQNR